MYSTANYISLAEIVKNSIEGESVMFKKKNFAESSSILLHESQKKLLEVSDETRRRSDDTKPAIEELLKDNKFVIIQVKQ